jgi:putative FmdB family regulatory protein
MPEYSFKCDNCDNRFSIICSIKEYSEKQRCPQCRHLKSVYRDYEEDAFTPNYIKGLHECKTVGEYADKQTKKYGKAKCEQMLRDFKTKKKPNTGMKELPEGMERMRDPADMPSPTTKQAAKRKRRRKNE